MPMPDRLLPEVLVVRSGCATCWEVTGCMMCLMPPNWLPNEGRGVLGGFQGRAESKQ